MTIFNARQCPECRAEGEQCPACAALAAEAAAFREVEAAAVPLPGLPQRPRNRQPFQRGPDSRFTRQPAAVPVAAESRETPIAVVVPPRDLPRWGSYRGLRERWRALRREVDRRCVLTALSWGGRRPVWGMLVAPDGWAEAGARGVLLALSVLLAGALCGAFWPWSGAALVILLAWWVRSRDG